MAQVCEALAHAHRHGVIHRDIKPSNLFLVKERRAKLLDFGIARLPSSQLTVAGQILGTPNYMSPEQILGRPSDGRADLFSAAVVFFEILVYTHPFRSQIIPRRIVEDEPDALFDHNSDIPATLERVLARGLAKDPNQRYCTGDEFAADIRAILDGLRQNASPSFSQIELPSERPLLTTQKIPELTISPAVPQRTPPAGEDPDEWRLSEVLRLMPEFEAALTKKEKNAARDILSELKTTVASDPRFSEAMRLCGSRLAGLDLPVKQEPDTSKSTPSDKPALLNTDGIVPIDTGSAAGQTPCSALEGPRAENTAGAATPRPAEGPSLVPLSRTPDSRTIHQPTSSKSIWTVRKWIAQERKIALLAAAAICLPVILILGFVSVIHPVPIEPAVATAVVDRSIVGLHVAPDSDKTRITDLKRGDRVSVIRLPNSRNQEWVQVQFIAKRRVFRPGYVKVMELRDWWSDKPQTALQLVENLGAGKSGNELDIGRQLAQLHAIETRFPNDPVSRKALLDASLLEMELASRKKDHGEADSQWRPHLQAAEADLARIENDPALHLQAEVAQAQQAVNSLASASAPAKDSAAVAEKPVTRSVDSMLQKAERLRKLYEYDDAMRIVREALKIQPGSLDAQRLLDKIQKAKDFETRTIH
jgi:serine/threonine protein kinase